MPEYVRSLVFISAIGAVVFFSMRPVFESLIGAQAFTFRRNMWLAVTAVAFLTPNIWVFWAAFGLILFSVRSREDNVPALFYVLLFVAPPAADLIPGFGLVNFLISVDPARLFTLTLLVPALLFHRPGGTAPRSRHVVDKLVFALFLLRVVLAFAREDSVTSALRVTAYEGLDFLVPYLAFSRLITTPAQLRGSLGTLLMIATVMAGIAMLETVKAWLIYRSMATHWGISYGLATYLMRGGLVRAETTTGQAIVLGYVLMLAMTVHVAFWETLRSRHKWGVAAILVGGLAACISRGPWLATIVATFCYWSLANRARARAGVAVGVLALLLVFTASFSGLDSLADLDRSSVDYRTKLLEKSIVVFWRTPWFGSDTYVQQLADLGMVQGQHIVDIVNTFVQVALASGFVGLALFVAVFLSAMSSLWKTIKRSDGEQKRLARLLFSMILGTMLTINSLSSITIVPWLYWSLAGAAVAYARIYGVRATESPRVATAAAQ